MLGGHDVKQSLYLVLVLSLASPLFLACHQAIRWPEQALRYSPRPAAPDPDLAQLLAAYNIEPAAEPAPAGPMLSANEVHQLAAARDEDVLAAQAKVAEARAGLATAGVWNNPELDGRLLADQDGQLGMEAALRFQIPLGGRIAAAEREARAELLLAASALDHARRRALAKADRLLARLAHAQARLGLFESLAQRSRQYSALAQTRRTASMADPLDVALIQADAAQDRRALTRARAEFGSVEQKLRLLTGLAINEGHFASPALDLFQMQDQEKELLAAALRTNPELILAGLTLKRAERHAEKMAAERWPDLGLGPALAAEGEHLGLGLTLSIALPLFHTGGAAYRQALSQRSGALTQYHQAARRSHSLVAQTLAQLKSRARELDELLGETSVTVEQALALAKVRFDAGKLDVLRLLSLHRAYSLLKLDQLDLLLALHEARVDLEQIIGRPLKLKKVMK